MTQTFIGNIVKGVKEVAAGANTFTIAYSPQGSKDIIYIRCVMFKDIVNFHKNVIKYFTKGCTVVVTGTISSNKVLIGKNNYPVALISFIVSSINFLPKGRKYPPEEYQLIYKEFESDINAISISSECSESKLNAIFNS